MSAEHAARWQHKRTASPTRHWPADPSVVGTHDGTVASCAACRECPTCDGAGVIVTNPEMAWSGDVQALHDVTCETCGGSGER